ncbi:MAG: hypothetical protein IJ214_11560 [Clostridia bacterium]|nr:hypothetical protein [Clostridia bacterium]
MAGEKKYLDETGLGLVWIKIKAFVHGQSLERAIYVADFGTVSSLPQTVSNAAITADMVVLEASLGTPSAFTGNITATTADGSVTLEGGISGESDVRLVLGRPGNLRLLSQPQAVSVADGTTVHFDVAATGVGLTYQWQWKSASGTDFGNSAGINAQRPTMYVTIHTAHNGGQYRCVVTDAAGNTAVSDPADVTVTS